ncbi:AraC family transcriptional regulator [Paraliomyxa miuraensis]|uniref:AraC family transcriptional regulator n=1 Tax=Paraliomyxa miuraensis TaxID=376150 RepID=UPI00224E22C9|nr:AraC family transcriptional regulator [Paraliomyxa miuraensis]MCX4245899.1 AraC family transcriptional regulator [Paraliomyxa miuraensis]
MKGTRAASIPAVHALHLVRLLEEDFAVSAAAVLEPLRLDAEALAEPGRRLSVGELERLVVRAHALCGDPALAVRFGMRMQISAHGYLGFAAMTAATIGDALRLAVRFAPTLTDALQLSLVEGEHQAALCVTEQAELGEAREGIVIALLVGIWRIGLMLTDGPLPGAAELAMPRPGWWVESILGDGEIRFDAPAHRLVFDRALLHRPIRLADPMAARLARQQCEQQLAMLGTAHDVVGQARNLLLDPRGGIASLPSIARALHLSTRTLKRRLAEAGCSYRSLVDDVRRERALVLLAEPGLDLTTIAMRLGYSDATNFSRAFRRWTGAPPSRYRRG